MLSGKDAREILASEMVTVTGGLLGGALLAFATGQIEMIPGLLILLPGFLEMHNAIEGSLSSRLSSGLWIHALKPRMHGRMLRGNEIASLLLTILVSVVIGIVAYLGSSLIFGAAQIQIILIALIAGVISHVIQTPFTIMMTFWLFRRRHDPNNVMGPYITTIGDIVSIISLLVAILIAGVL